MMSFDDFYMGASGLSRASRVQPMCIQLVAPLQICNVLSQSLLYRLSTNDGLITSEGTLVPGEVVDVHSLYHMFAQKVYISLRCLNYCWSKWTKIFTRKVPYPPSEKLIDVTLQSMELIYQSVEITLPPLDFQLSLREHLLRISCPVLICNRFGGLCDMPFSLVLHCMNNSTRLIFAPNQIWYFVGIV